MAHNSKMRRGMDLKLPAHELMVRFVYEIDGKEVKGEWVNVLTAWRSWLTPNEKYRPNVKRVEFEQVDKGEGNATIR